MISWQLPYPEQNNFKVFPILLIPNLAWQLQNYNFNLQNHELQQITSSSRHNVRWTAAHPNTPLLRNFAQLAKFSTFTTLGSWTHHIFSNG